MKKITSSSILIAFAFFCNAQIVIDNTQTPSDLVQNHLLGSGVYVSNISYQGSPLQIGSFTGAPTGITNGIIMSTGRLDTLGGAWAPASVFRSSAMLGNTDSTLNSTIPFYTTFDASVLEFDFKAGSDSVKFNFIFGSENYNDWVNTSYIDAFGFFISGPGFVGEQNIALIPGTTTPVSCNTVNNGGPYPGVSAGPCTNCVYYDDNVNGTTFAFDGYTTVLTAKAAVQPCEIYHIKLAVADIAQQIYDSFIMLEENSFQACSIPRLYINNSPILVDTIKICAGSSVQLSSIQAPNYLWNTGATTQTIIVTQAGDYSAGVFDGSCFVTSKVVHVEVLNLPPASVISNNGASITSTVTDTSYTYTWYHDGVLINGATSSTYNVNTGGCYLLIITDTNGCSISSNLLCLTFAGIDYVTDNNSVQAIPNPFTDKLTITTKTNNQFEVSLYDITSRKIFNQSFTTSTTINTEQLAKGIYIYEVRNKNGVIKKGKVVKD